MSETSTTTTVGGQEPVDERPDLTRLRPRRIRIVAAWSVDVGTLEPVLRALTARGHSIELAVVAGKTVPADAQRIAAELPLVRVVRSYSRRDDFAPLAAQLRSPRPLGPLSRLPALDPVATWLERALPTSATFDQELFCQALDLVVATAGVDTEVDWLLSARRAGIRTALLAIRWSDLDDIPDGHLPLDRVFVWNQAQRHAAMARFDLPADHAVIVGASRFDAVFGWSSPLDRAAFLTHVGLPANRPAILYAAGASRTAVGPWIRTLRESGIAELREASVLVMGRTREDLGALPSVAVVNGSAIHHADCVVTPDADVAVASAIAGRPTLSPPGSTLPFALTRAQGGPLLNAPTVAEHVEQLAQALRSPTSSNEAFLRAFIRPAGVDRPAAPLLADAIEDLLAEPWPVIERPRLAHRAVKPLMWWAACSPRMPVIKGLRRSARAERHATRRAERDRARPTQRRAGKG